MSVLVLEHEMVHYEVMGRGRPVLFLHGWVGSWRYWLPCLQTASMTYRSYAVDLWGFGDSAKVQLRYALEQQIQLLDGFIDQMGILRIALVGHGLGGLIAARYARLHPDVVDRVMVVGCPLEESMISQRLRSAPLVELADWLLPRVAESEPARVDAAKADAFALSSTFTSLAGLNLHELWTGMNTACLLVNGAGDPAVQPPNLDVAAGLPDKVHAINFEGCGHFPMLEDRSKFDRLLIDFLALPSGESPRQLQLKEEWKRRVR